MIAYAQQLELSMKERQPMVFIVEGTDCMGKTVLAKFIANKLKAAYFHSTAKGALAVAQKDYTLNVANNVRETILLSGNDYVLDRGWPSEHCYAPVLRPQSRAITCDGVTAVNYPITSSSELFGLFQEFNTVYIFCFSDRALEKFKEHQASPKERAHQYTVEQYCDIYKNYTDLAVKLANDDVPVSFYSIEKYGSNLNAYVDGIISQYGKKAQNRPI